MPFPVVNPLLTGCQLSPLSVDRSTPTGPPRGSPPAKIYPLALMANERNVAFGTPVLSPVQLSPLSVERNAPPPNVAAKTWPPALIARARTLVAVSPLLTPVHVSPLSVERNTPPPWVHRDVQERSARDQAFSSHDRSSCAR